MGVPAFFRWLSEKYPKTVIDMVEQRPINVEGQNVPLDLTEPNPNGMEFDNLYIDMNGIIHPCSHPEDRPTPKTEGEMFVNVMQYVDRIFAAVRPRRVVFLAIDGVAPRAKMNQQRTRRFRSAGEARERHEIKLQTRREMLELGLPVPPEELDKEWDSNVITPGTEFMVMLATYLRYYVAHRVNTCKAWQRVKVLFSDGSEPGEGEHKIMDFIRKERAQPGYDPNTRHILHGLDADLIMLALATHEPHFTILREQVFFGRKGRDGPQVSQAQQAYNAMQGQNNNNNNNNNNGVQDVFATGEGDRFPYLKPFQMLHVPTLREYLVQEFLCLQGGVLSFGYDFERVVDDFVFLCFFVGNDFLPHLPSLDIRDGAVDFLLNVYKRVLPAMGDYLTAPGGQVNLEKVDIILAEVGRVEDEVFRRRRQSEERHNSRLNQKIKNVEKRYGGSVQELAQKIVPADVQPLGKKATEEDKNRKNMSMAQILREQLKKKQKKEEEEEGKGQGTQNGAAAASLKKEEEGEGEAAGATTITAPSPAKRIKLELSGTTTEGHSTTTTIKNEAGEVEALAVSTEISITKTEATAGPNGEGMGGEDDDEEDDMDVEDEEEEEGVKEFEDPHIVVPPELEGTELAAAQKDLAARVKSKQEAKLDRLKEEIEDTIRYYEAGWKDRYYQDKLKKQNLEKGGGREHMYRTYIEGLCWVFQYYYRGCQAWGWFYPFHYAPFASDLVNIERYEIEFDMGTPLRPLEQLMAVLPPESADALPLPLAKLMCSDESPIKDFYPHDVEVDPNGKAMPWLWVTLLPFIDEGRLLTAINEAEKELTDAEKKRNVLGTSLLCLHEYHPTCRSIMEVLENDDPKATVEIAAAASQGFSGTLTKPPEEAKLALGVLLAAPKIPLNALEDVEDNRVLMAAYALPQQDAPHASSLLPGLSHPQRRLLDRDLGPRRPPRLGRGINIAELGMQFGFTEMHATAAQRMIIQNMPRGQGGGMMMASSTHYHQQQQQHQGGYGQQQQQYQNYGGPTGTRSWGSLEPINQQKYRQGGGPPGGGGAMGMRPSLYPGAMGGAGGRGPLLPPPLPPPMMQPPRPLLHPTPPLFPQPPMMLGGRPPYPGQHQHQQHQQYPPYPPGPPPPPPPPPPPGPPPHSSAPVFSGIDPGLMNSLRRGVAAAVEQRSQEVRGGQRLNPPGSRGGGGGGGGQQQHHRR